MALTRRIRSWSSWCLETLDALVFPMACEVCGADGTSSPFCSACRAELRLGTEAMCPRCACRKGPMRTGMRGDAPSAGGRQSLGFDVAVALGPYQWPIRAVCLQLKWQSGAWLAPWLRDLLVEVHGPRLRALRADRVVPVPLHWFRRWRRGYNQAEATVGQLARRLRPKMRRPLRRVQATEKLAGLGCQERAERTLHAFQARSDPALRGATVLLVDDILTIGATCGAAARALKQAGAARVVTVVVGRTVEA